MLHCGEPFFYGYFPLNQEIIQIFGKIFYAQIDAIKRGIGVVL